MNGEHADDVETLIAAAIDAAEEVRDPLDDLVERTNAIGGPPLRLKCWKGSRR